MTNGFILAAPSSGSGKTTITLALLAALKRRGVKVQPFKTGPDYIDTAHHGEATGVKAHNLDTWMLPSVVNKEIFAKNSAGMDIAVVEGVMGLFDGVDGKGEAGSTAALAKLLDLPVILIVDARSMAKSAAALVSGFVNFDKGVRFAGIIWNRVGSDNHRRILDEALKGAGLPPALGAFAREDEITIPERHLGLVTPEETLPRGSYFDYLASLAEKYIDIDLLLEKTRAATIAHEEPLPAAVKVKIAVAKDRAYSFYYEENLEVLRAAGGEILFFAPCEGETIPEGADALYLGGGYPEVHAEAISKNTRFLEDVRKMHEADKRIYAECGGFMTLLESLEDTEGKRWPMAGIFPAKAMMNTKRFRLGYREVIGKEGTPLSGQSARGHEFHYSKIEKMGDGVTKSYRVSNARGEALPDEGYTIGKTLGGYIHLHFGSNKEFALRIFGL